MQKQMLPGDCGNREWPPAPFTPAPCGTRPERTCPSVDAEKHSVPVFDCSQMVPYTGSRWLNSMVDSSATRLPLRVSQQAGGEKANSDPGCVPWREKLRQACGGSFSRIRVRFKPAGISTSPQSPQRIAEERPPPPESRLRSFRCAPATCGVPSWALRKPQRMGPAQSRGGRKGTRNCSLCCYCSGGCSQGRLPGGSEKGPKTKDEPGME